MGAAHGGAPEQYGGRAPHDPPMTTANSGRAEGGFRSAGAPGGAVHGPPLISPHSGAAPQPQPHAHAGGECADDTRGARMGNCVPPPRGRAGRPRRDPPPHPPHRPASRGGPGPQPPRQGGWSPLPLPERGAGARPAPPDAAQIAPSEGGRARTGVVWGDTPPMDRTTPVTPALLPAQGRQRDGTRQSDPPPYRPPPAAQTGGMAHAPPPPARPPAHKRHGPSPRHAAPTGQGDSVGPPHPHARAHSTWVADPNSPPSGRAVGGGGAPDPRRPLQQWKAPPHGDALPPPPQPQAKYKGTGTGPPPPKHARRSKGPGQDTRRGTDQVERPYQRPVPGQREVRTPHHPGGGGADAVGARAHTHAKGTRGLPEGQPDGARGTHRPHGMAYQRARVRDTQTGRPATRSAGHAGRQGGNKRRGAPRDGEGQCAGCDRL